MKVFAKKSPTMYIHDDGQCIHNIPLIVLVKSIAAFHNYSMEINPIPTKNLNLMCKLHDALREYHWYAVSARIDLLHSFYGETDNYGRNSVQRDHERKIGYILHESFKYRCTFKMPNGLHRE